MKKQFGPRQRCRQRVQQFFIVTHDVDALLFFHADFFEILRYSLTYICLTNNFGRAIFCPKSMFFQRLKINNCDQTGFSNRFLEALTLFRARRLPKTHITKDCRIIFFSKFYSAQQFTGSRVDYRFRVVKVYSDRCCCGGGGQNSKSITRQRVFRLVFFCEFFFTLEPTSSKWTVFVLRRTPPPIFQSI